MASTTPRAPSNFKSLTSNLRPYAYGLLVLLAAAALLRIALIPTTAHLTELFTDEFTFKRHVLLIHEDGLIDTFRDTNTSYVAYHYVMWVLTQLYDLFGGAFDIDALSLKALVKIPPLLLDLALIVATFVVTRRLLRDGASAHGSWLARHAGAASLGVAALVAFHPVVVYDSAVWAQIDGVVALSALVAVACAVAGNPVGAGAAIAFGLLNKPQPVIFAPILLVLLYRCSGVRGIAQAGAAGAVVTLVPLLPWLIAGDADHIVEVYRKLFSNGGQVTALTQNAWNLWWFIPFSTVPEPRDVMFTAGGAEITYQRFSLMLSALAALLSAAYAFRHPTLRGALIAASYIAVAFYVLPTSTHERYMYPLVVLLAPVALVEMRFRYVYAVLSATLFVNMFLVAPPVESWMLRWDDALITHYIAGLNVLMLIIFSWMLLQDILAPYARRSPQPSAPT